MNVIECIQSGHVSDFYQLLSRMRAVSPINDRIHRMLRQMQPDMSLSAQKLLYIYFSLLDDGNTRIALDAKTAVNRWMVKWDACELLAQENLDNDYDAERTAFYEILEQGIKDLLLLTYSNIIEKRAPGQICDRDGVTRPLVITQESDGLHYLYTARFFDAKCMIEARVNGCFKDAIQLDLGYKCEAFQEQFEVLFPMREPFELAQRQVEAIVRGHDENLIITGGPGTGKTTVICFMLYQMLMEHPNLMSWNIYLAAPSGKAADRMRESILECLLRFDTARMNECQLKVYEKLRELESRTLHRLLSYVPHTNSFLYNEDNPFPKKSLFIIDEASMIDVDLFAKFMSAIPENEYKLYIMGDANQLPSVEAGAVLGEILDSKRGFILELNESKRFDDNSEVGRLSLDIKRAKIDKKWPVMQSRLRACPHFTDQPVAICSGVEGAVNYYEISEGVHEQGRLKGLLEQWCSQFYIQTEFIQNVSMVDPLKAPAEQALLLKKIWNMAENARILCAERSGIRGVVSLNGLMRRTMISLLKKSLAHDAAVLVENEQPFYVGQILMLTKNLQQLKLYNGDSGIVVGEKNSGRLHLLLKKVQSKNGHGVAACDFVFYPLSVLPADAMESAFAITIHKSQGSGYPNILMFLPCRPGHPLLNNQIVYTGVTRTKNGTLTIVSSDEAIKAACTTAIVRDTGISLENTEENLEFEA